MEFNKSSSNIYEFRPGGVSGLGVDLRVEPGVFVGVGEDDGLLGLGHVAADAHAEGNNHVLGVGAPQGALETWRRSGRRLGPQVATYIF